jgi:hypothetical protein
MNSDSDPDPLLLADSWTARSPDSMPPLQGASARGRVETAASGPGAHAAALSDGHVSQDADRLASTRARRAATARDSRSAGIASPVPKERRSSARSTLRPRACLGIEIGEIRKPAPGEEIAFNETHRAFDARGPVRVALLVGAEDKVKPFGEGSHLRGGDHLGAGPRGDHDMRVIDHAGGARPGDVLQGVGQKHLARESGGR